MKVDWKLLGKIVLVTLIATSVAAVWPRSMTNGEYLQELINQDAFAESAGKIVKARAALSPVGNDESAVQALNACMTYRARIFLATQDAYLNLRKNDETLGILTTRFMDGCGIH